MDAQGSERLIDRLFSYFQDGFEAGVVSGKANRSDLFGFLVSRCSDAILITRKGNIVYANPSACRLLSCKDALSLVGTSLSNWYNESNRDVAAALTSADEPLAGPKPVQLLDLKGTCIDVELHTALMGGDGLALGMYCALGETLRSPLPDVSLLNEPDAERAKEARGALQAFAEAAFDAAWQWDIATGSIAWCSGLPELLGAPDRCPIRVEEWEQSIHPRDRVLVIDVLERHLQKGDPYDVRYRLLHEDGYRTVRERGGARRAGPTACR